MRNNSNWLGVNALNLKGKNIWFPAFTIQTIGVNALNLKGKNIVSYPHTNSTFGVNALNLKGKNIRILRAIKTKSGINTLNIKKPKEIINQVQNAVSNWRHFANEVKVDKVLTKAIESTLLYQMH